MEKIRSPHPRSRYIGTSSLPKGEGGRNALLLIVLLMLFATGSICAQEDETYSDDDTASVITNENYLRNPGWYLRNIDSSKIPTGILIDRVNSRKDFGLFNGKNRVKTCDYASWRKIYRLLKRSTNDTSVFPYLDNHLRYSKYLMRYEKTYPIGLINIKYNKIRRKALQNSMATETNNDLVIEQYDSSLFATKRLIIANTFQHRVHGDNVKFLIDSTFYFTNIKNEKIIKIEVNFDNGTGWQEITWNIPIDVKFISNTSHILVKMRLTIGRNDTSESRKYYAHFTVFRSGSDLVPEVSKINKSKLKSAPIPDDGMNYYPPGSATTMIICLPIPGATTTQCYGMKLFDFGSKIEYCILFGNNNTSGKLRKPIIICDGFDPGDNRNYFSTNVEDPTGDLLSDDYRGLYELMTGDKSAWSKDPGANLINELISSGYDIVFVNWTDGTGDIPNNAEYLRQFLNEIINSPTYRDNQTEEIILIGPSMAGLITRYCLTTMENADPYEEHHVKLWFAFDSPQEGAYIPIGLQFNMLNLFNRLDELDQWAPSMFVHDSKMKLKSKLNILQTSAAKQMLIIHLNCLGSDEDEICANYSKNNPGVFGTIVEKSSFYNKLSNKYPLHCKNIAISNGGMTKLYDDNKKQITNFKISPTFDMEAQKCENSTTANMFFWGPGGPQMIDELYAKDQIGYENAPGGFYSALYDFNQNDGNDSKPNHNIDLYPEYAKACFMPTVSTFGIKPTRANIYKTWNQISAYNETAFDEIHGMSDYGNEEHCRVSDKTSNWLQNIVLIRERLNIHKPYLRQITLFSETESKACLYTANNDVTFGGTLGNRFVFTFNSTADVKITAGNSIKFKPGVFLVRGAKLWAKTGTVSNGSQKSAIVPNRPSVTYLTPSPYNGKIYDYSEKSIPKDLGTSVTNHTITVYPNPSRAYVTLKFTGGYSGIASFKVRNIYGQIVLNDFISIEGEQTVNITSLPNGLYFFNVSLTDTLVSGKFIKK
jgi:hypothetical protein